MQLSPLNGQRPTRMLSILSGNINKDTKLFVIQTNVIYLFKNWYYYKSFNGELYKSKDPKMIMYYRYKSCM